MAKPAKRRKTSSSSSKQQSTTVSSTSNEVAATDPGPSGNAQADNDTRPIVSLFSSKPIHSLTEYNVNNEESLATLKGPYQYQYPWKADPFIQLPKLPYDAIYKRGTEDASDDEVWEVPEDFPYYPMLRDTFEKVFLEARPVCGHDAQHTCCRCLVYNLMHSLQVLKECLENYINDAPYFVAGMPSLITTFGHDDMHLCNTCISTALKDVINDDHWKYKLRGGGLIVALIWFTSMMHLFFDVAVRGPTYFPIIFNHQLDNYLDVFLLYWQICDHFEAYGQSLVQRLTSGKSATRYRRELLNYLDSINTRPTMPQYKQHPRGLWAITRNRFDEPVIRLLPSAEELAAVRAIEEAEREEEANRLAAEAEAEGEGEAPDRDGANMDEAERLLLEDIIEEEIRQDEELQEEMLQEDEVVGQMLQADVREHPEVHSKKTEGADDAPAPKDDQILQSEMMHPSNTNEIPIEAILPEDIPLEEIVSQFLLLPNDQKDG